MDLANRLKEARKVTGLGQREFGEAIGMQQGSYSALETGAKKVLSRAVKTLLELQFGINPNWLETGEGEMMLEGKANPELKSQSAILARGAPFYSTLPVSAGQMGLVNLPDNNKVEGYMDIPGVDAIAYFPVIGFSMQPTINPGDHIGVRSVNSWDVFDTDKVYLLITNDDRMVKHLRLDENDASSVYCVSQNFKEFKLFKSEIRFIYQVVYVGRFV